MKISLCIPMYNELSIIEDTAKAVSEAELLRTNTRNELREEFDKLKDLRISTLQAMTSYKDKLDAISKRLGADL